MADELVPELGDRVTIISNVFRSTTGRIVYRDDKLIRIRPDYRATSGVDFPLDPTTQLFTEAIGVSEVLIHEKRTNPAFAAQLAVFPNDRVLFYSTTGDVLGEPAIVDHIVVSETEDAIVLSDGRVIDFGFIGPQDPIAIVLPYELPEEAETRAETAAETETETETETRAGEQEVAAWEAELAELGIVSGPVVDDRTFDDVTQREDMFLSLLQNIPYKKQKDPRLLSRLYRETDILVALKNAIVVRDADNAIVRDEKRIYVAQTINDVLEMEPVPLSALLPVAAVKKVLYVDDGESGERADVVVRNDTMALIQTLRAAESYTATAGQNGFAAYIHAIDTANRVLMPMAPSSNKTRYDTDVLRSQIPPTPVEGFRRDLPPGYRIGRFNTRGAKISINANYVAKIPSLKAGLSRILAGSYLADPKTGIAFTVAEADTNEKLAHVLLSKPIAHLRKPLRSSVLLWDILSSDTIRAQRSTFIKYLDEHWDTQRVIHEGNDVVIAALVKERVKPSLSYMDRDAVNTLDSLGLRSLEMTGSLVAALQLGTAQQAWRMHEDQRKQRAIAAKETVSQPVVGSSLAADSALLAPEVLGNDQLKGVLTSVTDPLNAVAAITEGSSGTLLPLWIAIANKSDVAVIEPLEKSAESETRRLEASRATALAKNNRFRSKPKFNPCKHVVDIERIRNIKDTHKRMDMLETYIQTMGAGQAGHWILCGLCKLPLVCKHEVLLLQEFRHPGRGKALHKTLLLEYASPHVFEGSYICKLCGQPIQKIEYDTHLEFDDDGVPLSGRAVLEDEPDENGDDDTNELDILEESGKRFTGTDKPLYYIARTILERCGITGTEDMYDGMIAATKDFLRVMVPDEAYYNGRRALAIKAADDAKKAVAEGKKAAPVRIPPEYRKYLANFQVAVLSALTLFELQTAGLAIPFPAPGCVFATEGFPLDGDVPETAGRGGLSYIGCVVAGIYRSDMPWKATTWATETDLAKRRAATISAIETAALRLLGLPNTPPLTTVTDTYRKRFADRREARSTAESSDVLPSRADVLPPAFLPLPFQKPLAKEGSAVANEAALIRDIGSRGYADVEQFIGVRAHALSHRVLTEFNRAAQGVQRHPMRSEGICCATKLQDVKVSGLGYGALEIPEATKREIAVLSKAGLDKRDAAAPGRGTHLVVPWSAPLIAAQLPALQPELYYKLFLKKCAKGRRYGLTHEFNTLPAGSVCRHCGLTLPTEMRFLTISEIIESKDMMRRLAEQDEQRKVMALAAFESQGIAITDESFIALEAAVKKRSILRPVPVMEETDAIIRLQDELVNLPAVFLPDATDGWRRMLESLGTIRDRKLAVGVPRAQEWAKFSGPVDDMIRRLVGGSIAAEAQESETMRRLQTLVEDIRKTPLKKHDFAALLEGLSAIVQDPVTGAHTLLHYFVTLGEQTLTSPYTHEGSAKNLPLHKWFPNVNGAHLEVLQKIWIQNDMLVAPFCEFLKDPSRSVERKALMRMTAFMGPLLGHFIHEFRSSDVITQKEWASILRFIVVSMIQSLLSEASPLYTDAPSSSSKEEAVLFFFVYLQDVLSGAEAFSSRYQRDAEEIRRVLRVREEIEKSIFIRRFETLDKSLRDVEIVKKQLKLGDWGQGKLENLVNYRSATVGFQLGQIRDLGINDFGEHIGVAQPQAETAAERAGFRAAAPVNAAEGGYTNRVAMDEDV